jgi:hypothetical protein
MLAIARFARAEPGQAVMATISITGTPTVLSQLPTIGSSFPLALVRATATDNGTGTWTLIGHTAEANIPALTALGCSVSVLKTDAEELAQWEIIDTQIDSGPGIA